MKHVLPRAFLVFTAAAILAGCGSGFHSDFEAISQITQPDKDITGVWVGTWQNDDGHKGDLRAIITEMGPGVYKARYWANYRAGILTLTFEHETKLRGALSGSTFHFEGQEDLGMIQGTYTYEGYATPVQFFSTYLASAGDGTYKMRRPSRPGDVLPMPTEEEPTTEPEPQPATEAVPAPEEPAPKETPQEAPKEEPAPEKEAAPPEKEKPQEAEEPEPSDEPSKDEQPEK